MDMKYFTFLLFFLITSIALNAQSQLKDGWYHVHAFDDSNRMRDSSYLKTIDKEDLILPMSSIIKMKSVKSKMRPFNQLHFWFNEEGKEIWSKATKESIGKMICIIINGNIESIVFISTQITNGKSSFGKEKDKLKETENWIKQQYNL
ncbi:MAG: hypothetical protein COB15_09075 [Flavobacteriales bacterium]|nr:MAG: hypothetical protein COB15_09075 [Flavobacteriales bacterium]